MGKSGLDIIFALDVSSSIGKKSLETAKDFIKLLVKTFGVSKHADGGMYHYNTDFLELLKIDSEFYAIIRKVVNPLAGYSI